MNRDEVVTGIMRAAGLTKANVNRFYDGLVEVIKKRLATEGEFVLPGLGALVVRTRKARIGRNPQTGKSIQIPRKKVVRFRAYRGLRELLNPSTAQPQATQPERSETLPGPGEEAPSA